MAKEMHVLHKGVMAKGEREIIRVLLSEYDIQPVKDIQNALTVMITVTAIKRCCLSLPVITEEQNTG